MQRANNVHFHKSFGCFFPINFLPYVVIIIIVDFSDCSFVHSISEKTCNLNNNIVFILNLIKQLFILTQFN